MIIAIDGPAGAGKSTVAKRLARELGFLYIDTGAMYRAATLAAVRNGISFNDGPSIVRRFDALKFRFDSKTNGDPTGARRVFFGKDDISDAIRTPELTRQIKTVCAQKEVRDRMTTLQRELGQSEDSALEGRDIGTVVFPDAEFKFYLDASVSVRARRRLNELLASGRTDITIETLEADIRARDESDMNRKIAPLKKADDAIYIDTSNMTIEEVLNVMVDRILHPSE